MLSTLILPALLSAAATGVSASPVEQRWNDDSLKQLAQDKGKYFGTAYQSFYLVDERFEPILNTQFDQYTHENELKWEIVQAERGVFNWTGADLIFDQAAKTNSIVRGHTLVWHSQLPEWVSNITDAEELKGVMKTHIDAVMGRYGDRLAHMDVVNEPLEDNATFRDSVFYNLLGEDFIRLAFEYAHEAAPNVKLYLNDFNTETISNKSLKYAEITQGLLDQGAPIDGFGFQCHFIGGSVPEDIAETMRLFTDQGLEVAFTELDVRVPVNNRGLTNSTWLDIQAQDYSNVVQACLDNDLCPGVTIWGFGDETSWVPGVFAGEGAAGIYDFDYREKPAFWSLQNTLRG